MTAAITEARGRLILAARSGGRCEACRDEASDASHRVDRSDGGTWSPANLCHLCRRCHQWFHSYPQLAYLGGWRLPSGTDPLQAVVWLWTAYGRGWWLLDEAGNYAFAEKVPTLPPWIERQ